MRHIGSVSQVNKKRNEALLSLFAKAKYKVSYPTSMTKICRVIADMPVGEFFISDEAATVYACQRYYHGEQKLFRSPRRQLLYEAFYKELLKLKAQAHHTDTPISALVTIALMMPAPCIGLEPSAIYMILPHKRHKKRRMKK